MINFFKFVQTDNIDVRDYAGYEPFISRHFHAYQIIGEDPFGNLLIDNMNGFIFIFCHEDGSVFDTEIDKATFMNALKESGCEWIDFYEKNAFKVYESLHNNLTADLHIHWIQPLALGGSSTLANASLIDRKKHFSGHTELLSRIDGFDPGSWIIFK